MPRFQGTLAYVSFVALLAADAASGASALEIRVLDRNDQPVEDVAVYATPIVSPGTRDVGHQDPAAVPTAMMEQTDNAFVPHLLIAETGTEVTFPNNDTVSHHVYSFSDAKSFELSLYKGNVHPPVRFDRPGVVVLGCNIHDGMLGYIFIVDSPHFARTDGDGRATIAGLPPGRYSVAVWTPRARSDELPRAAAVTVPDGGVEPVAFRFDSKLKPPHEHGGGSLTWDRY